MDVSENPIKKQRMILTLLPYVEISVKDHVLGI